MDHGIEAERSLVQIQGHEGTGGLIIVCFRPMERTFTIPALKNFNPTPTPNQHQQIQQQPQYGLVDLLVNTWPSTAAHTAWGRCLALADSMFRLGVGGIHKKTNFSKS